MFSLSHRAFHDEVEAYAYVEGALWPSGPTCPRCGCHDRVGRLGGRSTRIGVLKCYECCKPFTVKIGTIFESSHVPMRLWLQALLLLETAETPPSLRALSEVLGITFKSAWYLRARIMGDSSAPGPDRQPSAAILRRGGALRQGPFGPVPDPLPDASLSDLSPQSRRFVQAAFALGCDQTGEAFGAAFARLLARGDVPQEADRLDAPLLLASGAELGAAALRGSSDQAAASL